MQARPEAQRGFDAGMPAIQTMVLGEPCVSPDSVDKVKTKRVAASGRLRSSCFEDAANRELA